jgi:hypothetical protein
MWRLMEPTLDHRNRSLEMLRLPCSATAAIGYISELKCIEALYLTGHHVAIPPVPASYDIVASVDGYRWSRIQVKTLSEGGGAALTRSNGAAYSPGSIDEFMVVDPVSGAIWRFGADEKLEEQISKTKPWQASGRATAYNNKVEAAKLPIVEGGNAWTQVRSLLALHMPSKRPDFIEPDMWQVLTSLRNGRTIRELAVERSRPPSALRYAVEYWLRQIVRESLAGRLGSKSKGEEVAKA